MDETTPERSASAERRRLHDEASDRGDAFYVDPESGLAVFTAHGLRRRGRCCGSGCRHCPYGPPTGGAEAEDAARAEPPLWLTPARPPDEPADVLFWSGGKDSFLAYRALMRERLRPVILLTTFDSATRTIAHQELDVAHAARQASHLGAPLLGVPLFPGRSYEARIEEAVDRVPSVARLVFGDLHLDHVRDWRDGAFGRLAARLGASLEYPLWQVSYDALMADLEASGVVCEVCAVSEAALGALQPGQRFDRDVAAALPEGVDAFGENGEFHTLVKVWESDSTSRRARPPSPVGSARRVRKGDALE